MSPPGKRRRSYHADAFIPDPGEGPVVTDDDLAQTMGEELVQSATTGQDPDQDVLNATVPEEMGGPFVETSDYQELAFDADANNPPGTVPEALPTAVAGTVTEPATIDEDEDEGDR